MLFSHPADFTPVCTTEFVAFAELAEEFTARNVALLGNSIDSVYSHLAWTQAINDKLGVRTLSGCLTEQTARAVAAGPGRIAGLATPVMAVTGTVVEDIAGA